MRKLFLFILALLLVCSAAAEPDLAAMSTDELLALRDSIDNELSNRNEINNELQIINVDGLLLSIDSIYLGTGRNDAPAICILFNASNTSDNSFTPLYDLGCDILQNGVALETTFFNSDSYTGPSVSASNNTVIAPGIDNIKLCAAGIMSGDSDDFSIVLSRKHTSAGDDPYCGSFTFKLTDYLK